MVALKAKRIGGAELVKMLAPVTEGLPPTRMPVTPTQEDAMPSPERQASADAGTKSVVVSVNLPLDLLADMREAADRRALRQAREHPKGRGGRPSVSAIITEILQRHREEIEGIG
jgi:hypothetical protein